MAGVAGVTGPWRALDERLRDLEQREKRSRRIEGFWGTNEFKVSPTCPPSTSIHVRGGMAWAPFDFNYPGTAATIESMTLDLSDEGDVYYPYIFTTAYYYAGCIISGSISRTGDRWTIDTVFVDSYVSGGAGATFTVERATSAEAEDDCGDILFDDSIRPAANALPLCAVILRNDGTIGVEGAYMAIDAVNRGRSYLWRDIRPRGQWVIGNI